MDDSIERQVELSAPDQVRKKLVELRTMEKLNEKELLEQTNELRRLKEYLAISESVSDALELLSAQLFQETLATIEEKLSIALQEILGQPIKLVAQASWKNRSAAVDFHIERNGFAEDIMRGQGGSVANILSIGLRMFALTNLDPQVHRPFLIFDEQDCWLRPDLVPPLVRIIRQASRALGYQVLMISHHDREIFEQYADRIYRLSLDRNATAKVELQPGP